MRHWPLFRSIDRTQRKSRLLGDSIARHPRLVHQIADLCLDFGVDMDDSVKPRPARCRNTRASQELESSFGRHDDALEFPRYPSRIFCSRDNIFRARV